MTELGWIASLSQCIHFFDRHVKLQRVQEIWILCFRVGRAGACVIVQILPNDTRHCAGSTIALTIRSFDPLERGDWVDHDSIDISGISIAVAIHSLHPLECKRRKIA